MTREAQKLIFADGEIPTGANYSDLIDQIPLIVPLISDLPTAAAGNLGQVYCVGGINYRCEETSTGVYEWVNKNAAAAANDYSLASNKPKINGVLLSGNKTSKDLGIDTLNSNEFTQDYPFLYFQSNGSMLLTNTASTSELILTDDTTNYIEWQYTPTQNGIIKGSDEVNVQFSITGLQTGTTYNAIIEVYVNSLKIAEKTTVFTNPLTVAPQTHKLLLDNLVGDFTYLTSDVVKVKLSMNRVSGSGAVTIYIYNSSTRSSYLNIRKYVGQTNDTTETLTSGTTTLYNSQKNTLKYINYTNTGNLTAYISPYTSTLIGGEIYGTEHEVIIYNNSGATRTITVGGDPTSYPVAITGSVDDTKSIYFKYKIINVIGYIAILITDSQINI